MKIGRFGQAEPLEKKGYLKLRAAFFSDQHKLFGDIAWFTAERPLAILKLGVTDVYADPVKRIPRKTILFKGNSRKTKDSRSVPVSKELEARLRAYQPPTEGWLFPSLVIPYQHLSLRAMDGAFRRAMRRLGWEALGYSLYSFRRGALTSLRRQGLDLRVIQQFSGHKNLNVLARYLEVDERSVIAAAELL